MDTNEQVIEIQRFQGLHESIDAENIADGELAILRNMDVMDDGTLMVRPGLEPLGANAGLFAAPRYILGGLSKSTLDHILAYLGDGVYYTTDQGTFWQPRLLVPGANIPWPGVQYAGKFYWADGTLHAWDGAVLTAPASAPANIGPTFLHKDRLFAISIAAATRHRVYFSEIGDPTTWVGSSFIDVQPDDGDVIVGGISYNGDVYIFKTRSTWKLTVQGDTSEWFLTKFQDIGAMNTSAILIYNSILHFSSRDGIYRTNGSDLERITTKLNWPRLIEQSASDAAAPGAHSLAVCDNMLISYSSYPNNKWYVMNLMTEAWSQYIWANNLAPKIFYTTVNGFNNTRNCVTLESAGNPRALLRFSRAYAYPSDAGFVIVVKIQTKRYTLGSYFTKRFKSVYLIGFGDINWPVTWVYSNGGAMAATSTTNLPPFKGTARVKGPGFFRAIAMELNSPNGASPMLSLSGISMVISATKKAISAVSMDA